MLLSSCDARLDVHILVNIFNRISDCRGETRLDFTLDESLDEASFLFLDVVYPLFFTYIVFLLWIISDYR